MENKCLKIVVIDDDPAELEIVQHYLKCIHGWEIDTHTFHNSQAAMDEILLDKRVDIIFLDYLLGHETGVEALTKFNQAGLNIPVIGLTSHGNEDIAIEMLHTGAMDYLQKGVVSEKSLKRSIENALRRNHLETQITKHKQNQEITNRALHTKKKEMLGFQYTLGKGVRPHLDSAIECLNMLLQNLAGPILNEQRVFLESAHDSCQVMQRQIADLLDATRLETGNFSLDIHSTSLAALVRKAIVTMCHQVREKGLHITHDLADDLPMVRVDPTRIFQVLINLVDNAITSTREGGAIVIRGRINPSDESQAQISVEDNGNGATTEKLDSFFTPEDHSEQTPGVYQPSLGMGLKLSGEIVKHHGGELSAQSHPDKGTIITFTLPLAKAPQDVT